MSIGPVAINTTGVHADIFKLSTGDGAPTTMVLEDARSALLDQISSWIPGTLGQALMLPPQEDARAASGEGGLPLAHNPDDQASIGTKVAKGIKDVISNLLTGPAFEAHEAPMDPKTASVAPMGGESDRNLGLGTRKRKLAEIVPEGDGDDITREIPPVEGGTGTVPSTKIERTFLSSPYTTTSDVQGVIILISMKLDNSRGDAEGDADNGHWWYKAATGSSGPDIIKIRENAVPFKSPEPAPPPEALELLASGAAPSAAPSGGGARPRAPGRWRAKPPPRFPAQEEGVGGRGGAKPPPVTTRTGRHVSRPARIARDSVDPATITFRRTGVRPLLSPSPNPPG